MKTVKEEITKFSKRSEATSSKNNGKFATRTTAELLPIGVQSLEILRAYEKNGRLVLSLNIPMFISSDGKATKEEYAENGIRNRRKYINAYFSYSLLAQTRADKWADDILGNPESEEDLKGKFFPFNVKHTGQQDFPVRLELLDPDLI